MFLSREGTSIARFPTYLPQTSNARNPAATRKAEVVPSMVGQLSQSVRVTLSKPSFTVAFIRPLRAECFVYSSVTARRKN